MLGWFKKKLKKQEQVAPVDDTAEDISSPAAPLVETGEPDSKTAPEGDESPANLQAVEEERPAAAPRSPVTKEEEQLPQSDPIDGAIPKEDDTAPQPGAEEIDEAALPPAESTLKITRETDLPKEQGKQKRSLLTRLTEKLGKTRETFTYQLDALFLGKKEIDANMLDELEEILITADLGVTTTLELLENARRKVKRKELYDPKSLKETLKIQIRNLILENDRDATLVMPDKGPFVIMVIGVNGVGKTTTIGKIARKFQQAGNSVMLVAGDTFRAAAVAQLKIWGERSNVPVIAHKEGADPSSVVFDALGTAQEENIDVVLVDTAGRMHTKDNLMEELKKIKRVIGKKLKGAPHEVLLVIDATTGQNGISQARLFDDAVGVTGMALTKLDGTSKGGIVANICKEMKIPIRFIGIGEKMNDLRDFDADEFVEALFHSGSTKTEN